MAQSSFSPRVTVVMATYNAMPFLTDAVESILHQTLRDFRLIIVNDGSTDQTAKYLASIDDHRVTVEHQANQGQQAAANRGVELSCSEYIARMDADDVAEPTRLEKQVTWLDANPDVGLLGSQFRYFGKFNVGSPSKLPCTHQKIYRELINNRHAICNCSTMFRAELFRGLGGYWDHDISEDWDLFLRAGERMKLANLNESLIRVRLHPGSINGRRMFESQLHNEYACDSARNRNRQQPTISFEEFCRNHPYRTWPASMFFRMDCHAVSHYRLAMADILDGYHVRGYSRLLASMACSPVRTIRRVQRML